MPKYDLNVDAFIASLNETEKRRLSSAVKIIAEWLLNHKAGGAKVISKPS